MVYLVKGGYLVEPKTAEDAPKATKTFSKDAADT
jgi:hypothetical protein